MMTASYNQLIFHLAGNDIVMYNECAAYKFELNSTGVFASLKSNCGLKGAAILHNWLPLCNSILWAAGYGCPFLFWVTQSHPYFSLGFMSNYPKNKSRLIKILGTIISVVFIYPLMLIFIIGASIVLVGCVLKVIFDPPTFYGEWIALIVVILIIWNVASGFYVSAFKTVRDFFINLKKSK